MESEYETEFSLVQSPSDYQTWSSLAGTGSKTWHKNPFWMVHLPKLFYIQKNFEPFKNRTGSKYYKAGPFYYKNILFMTIVLLSKYSFHDHFIDKTV